MRCPSCGSDCPDDADRCPECGAVPEILVSDREEAADCDVEAKVWTYNGRSMVELARTPEGSGGTASPSSLRWRRPCWCSSSCSC